MGLRDWLTGIRDRSEVAGAVDEFDDDRDDREDGDEAGVPAASSAEELVARLHALGLGAYADALAAAGRRGVRLVQTDEDGPAAGSSRLGGVPDLPAGTAWPRHEGAPLAFIAQLDLAGLVRALGREAGLLAELPPTGVLSFFALVDDSTGYGLLHEEAGSFCVLHHAGPGEPVRLPDDLESEARLAPVPVGATADWTAAPYESGAVTTALAEADNIDDYLDAIGGDDDLDGPPRHRVLGNPDQIQGDLAWEAADATGTDTDGWRLLLQVDSDEEGLGVVWGDLGRLYWMIREDDLRAHRWERVHLIGQCY